MKTIKYLLALAVALCASAFAGTLTDAANIFGPRSPEVGAALASLPVHIETRVHPPADGLQAYADAQAKALPDARGFYVVITTQPRQWRISMSPVGLASSESVRLAGDAMTSEFRRGRFTEGAIALALNLERLTHSATSGVPVEGAKPTTGQADMSASELWCWIVGGAAVLLFGSFLLYRLTRKKTSGVSELQSDFRRQPVDPTPITSTYGFGGKSAPTKLSVSMPPVSKPARIVRKTHVHNHASSSSSGDIALGMIIGHSLSSPSRATHTTDDDDRRRSSSYESSSSSSSYDAGSSFSSSDSGGASGSWD